MSFLVSDRTGGNYELSLADGGALPVFTATGNAAGGNGILVFPNIAAMSAFDAAGLPAGGQTAYVQSVGAYWVLQPGEGNIDGITEATATDSSGHARYWERWASGVQYDAQAELIWYIDPLAGNDENVGTNSGAPLKTKAELARRWGTWSPEITNPTTVTFLSADTNNLDPWLGTPTYVNGGSLLLTAPLPAPSFTGTLNVVTAKNTGAGSTALQSTFTATTGAIATGMLLVNTTRGNSRAFVQLDTGGGNWQLSQPMTPYVASGRGFYTSSEVDTWTNGDAINGYALTEVQIAQLGGQTTEAQAGLNGPSLIVTNLAVRDGDYNVLTSDLRTYQLVCECEIKRSFATLDAGGLGQLSFFANCAFHGGQSVFISTTLIAGYCGTTIAAGEVAFLGGSASGSLMIVESDCIFGGSVAEFASVAFSGNVCISSQASGTSGQCQIQNATVYGGGAFAVEEGQLIYTGQTAVATFRVASFQIGRNASTTAYSIATAGGASALHQLAMTPAALDAAAGAAGFGGYAFLPGQACVSLLGATP